MLPQHAPASPAPTGAEPAPTRRPQEPIVIEEWLLLECAVCFLPANQDALVESVSKGGLELPDDFLKAIGVVPTPISRRISPQRARRKDNAENDGPCFAFLRALRILCGEIIRRRRRLAFLQRANGLDGRGANAHRDRAAVQAGKKKVGSRLNRLPTPIQEVCKVQRFKSKRVPA